MVATLHQIVKQTDSDDREVALSTEADYIAMASAIQEALWLKQLAMELNGIKEDDSMLIFCDMSTIVLAKGDGYRTRTTHIDVRTTS